VDSAVALTSLKCLKRIVSARKRIFTEKTKKRQFAKEMYAGAIYLFEKVQSSTEEVVSDILEFNSKLNANFGLR
jgi:exportin-7